VRFFASSASLLDLTLPDHNLVLAGDQLTTLSLNFEWRKLIASALEFYFSHGETGLALDNDDLFNNLLIDLYNFETIGNAMKSTIYEITLAATRTTTSAVYVVVDGSEIVHTFTFSNAIVKYKNMSMVGSAAGTTNDAVPTTASGAFVASARAFMTGTTPRNLEAMANYEGLDIGVPYEFALVFRATGGTASITVASKIIVEILEWE